MMWATAAMLLALWAVGLLIGLGGYVHGLLVVAIAMGLLRWVQLRRAALGLDASVGSSTPTAPEA
ncbi:MAG: hypothetical protein ACKVX7_11295 [Planctomycetota bacterium]